MTVIHNVETSGQHFFSRVSCPGNFLSYWWGRPGREMCLLRRKTWWLGPVIGSGPTTARQQGISSSRPSGREGKDRYLGCLILRGRKVCWYNNFCSCSFLFVLFHYRNNGVPNKLFNVIAPQSAVDFMPYRERKRSKLRTSRRGNHSHILASNDTTWNI